MKKQESMAHSKKEKKKKLTEIVPKEDQALQSLDKDFKSIVIIYVQMAKGNHGQWTKGHQENNISIIRKHQ